MELIRATGCSTGPPGSNSTPLLANYYYDYKIIRVREKAKSSRQRSRYSGTVSKLARLELTYIQYSTVQYSPVNSYGTTMMMLIILLL